VPEFIPLAKPHLSEEEKSAMLRVMESGWWTTGPEVQKFEKEMEDYLGAGVHALALNSCTSALFLALKAQGIGPGDKVLVPTWTFAATAMVVEWCGAEPVLVDVQAENLNVSLEHFEKAWDPSVKAVIPVHVAGIPVDLNPILNWCEQKDVFCLEDAAHAIGSKYGDRLIGSHSHAVAFSFYVTKNLACGEGGMLVSTNEEWLEKVRKISYFGIDKSAHQRYQKKGSWFYEIESLGFKCNLDNLHASIARVQLAKLEEMNSRRAQVCSTYDKNLPGELLFPASKAGSSHHLYMIRLPGSVQRDDFCEGIRQLGVGSSVHFRPLHRHEHYKGDFPASRFPEAESIADKVVSLPLYPDLSHDEVMQVVKAVRKVLGK